MNIQWTIAFGAVAATLAWLLRRKTEQQAVPVEGLSASAGRQGTFLNSVTFRSSGSGPGPTQDPPQVAEDSTAVPAEGDVIEQAQTAGVGDLSGPSNPKDPPQ